MLNIILFGPPGSGKGTQAKLLVQKYQLIHISTGDLFRYEIGNSTPLGLKAQEYMSKGELVPDEVTIGMLKNKVESHPESKGFIFDGFPRTIPQSEAFDVFLNERDSCVTALIALDVSEEELIGRLLDRGKTSGRVDDNNEITIRNRIEVYKAETAPVFDYYKDKGLSHFISGVGNVEEIFETLSSLVDRNI